MTTSTRITIPIRGNVHEGEAPVDAGGEVFAAAAGTCVCSAVVITCAGVVVWAASVGIAFTRGEETVMYPCMVVVLSPPEFVVVRLTE